MYAFQYSDVEFCIYESIKQGLFFVLVVSWLHDLLILLPALLIF